MVDESNENLLTESAYEVSEHLTIPVYADVQRYPCSNCGRAFNVESLVNRLRKIVVLHLRRLFSENINQFVKIPLRKNKEKYSIWGNNVQQIRTFLMQRHVKQQK